MKRRIVYFVGPRAVEVREEVLPDPGQEQVLVRTDISAVSAGTEMLIYRGQFPRDVPDALDKISSELNYPLPYGYACVGRIVRTGSLVDEVWQDRLVFSFQPHASHFVCETNALLPVPDDITPDDAVFLPNMETAVNVVQDAAPLLGERILIMGQGIVGLLTAALLHEFPLAGLVSADRYELRRKASMALGITHALDAAVEGFRPAALKQAGGPNAGFDLVVELTGNPSALNDAIALVRFSGRVLVASWYGEKKAPLDLGLRFHHSRIKLISSQVSSIAPELSARWDKARRYDVAWDAIRRHRPSKWITHRVPLDQASRAYALLDTMAEQALQLTFNYS